MIKYNFICEYSDIQYFGKLLRNNDYINVSFLPEVTDELKQREIDFVNIDLLLSESEIGKNVEKTILVRDEIITSIDKTNGENIFEDNLYNVNVLLQPITFRILQLQKLFNCHDYKNIEVNIVDKIDDKFLSLYGNMNILLIDILNNFTKLNLNLLGVKNYVKKDIFLKQSFKDIIKKNLNLRSLNEIKKFRDYKKFSSIINYFKSKLNKRKKVLFYAQHHHFEDIKAPLYNNGYEIEYMQEGIIKIDSYSEEKINDICLSLNTRLVDLKYSNIAIDNLIVFKLSIIMFEYQSAKIKLNTLSRYLSNDYKFIISGNIASPINLAMHRILKDKYPNIPFIGTMHGPLSVVDYIATKEIELKRREYFIVAGEYSKKYYENDEYNTTIVSLGMSRFVDLLKRSKYDKLQKTKKILYITTNYMGAHWRATSTKGFNYNTHKIYQAQLDIVDVLLDLKKEFGYKIDFKPHPKNSDGVVPNRLMNLISENFNIVGDGRNFQDLLFNYEVIVLDNPMTSLVEVSISDRYVFYYKTQNIMDRRAEDKYQKRGVMINQDKKLLKQGIVDAIKNNKYNADRYDREYVNDYGINDYDSDILNEYMKFLNKIGESK